MNSNQIYEIHSIKEALKRPNVAKEYKILLNQIRTNRTIWEQYALLITEIIPRFERELNQVHTYQNYYLEMVILLQKEATYLHGILDKLKKLKEDYGWLDQSGYDGEPSGWVLEGGEDAYFEALKKWENEIKEQQSIISERTNPRID